MDTAKREAINRVVSAALTELDPLLDDLPACRMHFARAKSLRRFAALYRRCMDPSPDSVVPAAMEDAADRLDELTLRLMAMEILARTPDAGGVPAPGAN